MICRTPAQNRWTPARRSQTQKIMRRKTSESWMTRGASSSICCPNSNWAWTSHGYTHTHTHTHRVAVPPKLIIKLMVLKEFGHSLLVFVILPFQIQTGTTQDYLSALNLREQRMGFPAFYDLEILPYMHTCHKHTDIWNIFGIHNEFIYQ